MPQNKIYNHKNKSTQIKMGRFLKFKNLLTKKYKYLLYNPYLTKKINQRNQLKKGLI